jgi:hypothetical protein
MAGSPVLSALALVRHGLRTITASPLKLHGM